MGSMYAPKNTPKYYTWDGHLWYTQVKMLRVWYRPIWIKSKSNIIYLAEQKRIGQKL